MQVYAQWPGSKDDETNASDNLLMSSIAVTRTVRRVRNFDDLSENGTAGGSQIKEPNERESKQFLASLSKAFAPELLDLQVGLMKGNEEIIPLGVATVVIPGEYKRIQLDIPVVRNYSVVGENALSKKKRGVSRSGKAKTPADHVLFSSDKDTVYKINDGAFLRLELDVEPATEVPGNPAPSHLLNSNVRKSTYTAGPINQALRRRRKMDYLMTLDKLPVHQRIQLYFELRSRKDSNNQNRVASNSQEVCISRQSEVSEVSCDVVSADDASVASLLIDQYDLRRWESGLATVEEPSIEVGNSLVGTDGGTADVDIEMLTQVSQHSSGSASTDISGDEVSFQRNKEGEETVAASKVSINSFLDNDEADRLSPTTAPDDLSYFSSSLHSVFMTNHPQKQTIAQNILNLLGCEPDLVLCDEERNALKYYAQEHGDEKCAHYFCVPSHDEEYTIYDTTCADEDTLASLESYIPVKVNKK